MQPLLDTEEINSTFVWPIIHMIRGVCSTHSSAVFPRLTPAPGCYGNPLSIIPTVRLVEQSFSFRLSALYRYPFLCLSAPITHLNVAKIRLSVMKPCVQLPRVSLVLSDCESS